MPATCSIRASGKSCKNESSSSSLTLKCSCEGQCHDVIHVMMHLRKRIELARFGRDDEPTVTEISSTEDDLYRNTLSTKDPVS